MTTLIMEIQQPNLWLNPAVIAAFISAAVAITGAALTYIDNRRKHRDTLKHNRDVLSSTKEMNDKVFLYQTREIENKKLEERKKFLYKKLNDFYIPLTNYLGSSKALYDIFKVGKPSSDEFRTLTHLLNPNKIYSNERSVVLSNNDKVVLNQIFDIGSNIIKLIDEKGGLIDDEELIGKYTPSPEYTDVEFEQGLSLLSLAQTHFRIIKLAFEGDLTDNAEKYEKYVYPRELNVVLSSKIEQIKTEIQKINEQINGGVEFD